MSQQGLAVALKTTTRSVARWETAAFPHGRIVKRLEQFATKRGLTDHAAQFRRLYRQEQFLKANEKYFWTPEGLDLQVAIAQVRQYCQDPEVAQSWSNTIESLTTAVARLLDLPKSDTDVWETDEIFDLWERLCEYAKQPWKKATGLQTGARARKQDKEPAVTIKRKKSK